MKTKIFTLTIGLLISCLSITYAQNPGDLDADFGINGSIITGTPGYGTEAFQDIAIQDDQKIIAAGIGWNQNYIGRTVVIRYMPDGSVDTDFGVDGKFIFELDNEALVYGCAITNEGKIVLAGTTTDYSAYKALLIQLNSDGTLDSSFGDNGIVVQQLSPDLEYFEDFARDVALDADGNILISGNTFNAEFLRQPIVARFSPTGVLDTSFGAGGIATIPVVQDGNSFDCLTIQSDGKILAAGTFSPQFLWNLMLLVRFNSDGSLDTTFGEDGIVKYSQNDVDDEVFNMALAADGSILLSGFSATASYEYFGILVKYTTDGILDTSFGTDGVVLENDESYNESADIQIQSDGKIIVGGTTGTPPPGAFDMAVWKYNADGTRDEGFGTNGLARHTLDGFYGMLHGIALQSDNRIVAVGQARTELNDNDLLVVRLNNEIISGVNELDLRKAPKLSPNPVVVSSQINIQLSETLTANAALEFFDMTGKLVKSIPLEASFSENQIITTTIPSDISNGIYLVKISQKGILSSATKLVIIK